MTTQVTPQTPTAPSSRSADPRTRAGRVRRFVATAAAVTMLAAIAVPTFLSQRERGWQLDPDGTAASTTIANRDGFADALSGAPSFPVAMRINQNFAAF